MDDPRDTVREAASATPLDSELDQALTDIAKPYMSRETRIYKRSIEGYTILIAWSFDRAVVLPFEPASREVEIYMTGRLCMELDLIRKGRGRDRGDDDGDDGAQRGIVRFWISWWEPAPDGDSRPLVVPPPSEVLNYWETGMKGWEEEDVQHSLCAAVEAPDQAGAEEIIRKHWKPAEWRFCHPKPDDFDGPTTDRFPRPAAKT